MKGRILRGVGGFYYVSTEEGLIETRGRGIFRKTGKLLMVGDEVELSVLPDGSGVIEKILPRTSEFRRPPIANADTVVIVFCPRSPRPNYEILDKYLIMAEVRGVEAVLCLNKADLLREGEREKILSRYRGVGEVTIISAKSGEGLNQLRKRLKGRKAALAGTSGVGKSTITNALIPEASMETGAVSDKMDRGRHTTRHVEIFPMEGGGLLYDTPGFLSLELDLSDVEPENLGSCFPEFRPYEGSCRFDDCRHVHEPGCRVREAAEAGEIHPDRYASYLRIYEELRVKAENRNRRHGR